MSFGFLSPINGASLVAQLANNPPVKQETWVQYLGWENSLEKERIPTPVLWPGEFHGLYSPWGCKELGASERFSLSPINIHRDFIFFMFWDKLSITPYECPLVYLTSPLLVNICFVPVILLFENSTVIYSLPICQMYVDNFLRYQEVGLLGEILKAFAILTDIYKLLFICFIILNSYQQYMKSQFFQFSEFFCLSWIFTNTIGEKWFLSVTVLSISLKISEVSCFFNMLKDCCLSSLLSSIIYISCS